MECVAMTCRRFKPVYPTHSLAKTQGKLILKADEQRKEMTPDVDDIDLQD